MSTHHYHAVIWIDHHEARLFHFNPTDVERLVPHPDRPTRHIHHKANSIGSGHAAEDQDYLHAVAAMMIIGRRLPAIIQSLGELTQASAAFVTVQAAFNWLVDNFQRLSDWRAATNRVATLLLALDQVSEVEIVQAPPLSEEKQSEIPA